MVFCNIAILFGRSHYAIIMDLLHTIKNMVLCNPNTIFKRVKLY